MTAKFARFTSSLALSLGLSALTLALAPAVMAQTAAPADGAAAAPADPGVSMGIPEGLPDQTQAAVGQLYLANTFDSWEQRCTKSADGADLCQLYQLVKDESGAPISEVVLFALPDGGQAAMGANILAPLETLLTANIRIAVDGDKGKLYPFYVCTSNGCLAKVGFTAAEVDAMKKGKQLTMTVVPAASPDKTVVINVPLKGFSAGAQAVKDALNKIKK
jgi:invasion protein IalB